LERVTPCIQIAIIPFAGLSKFEEDLEVPFSASDNLDGLEDPSSSKEEDSLIELIASCEIARFIFGVSTRR
jgi:hypothetical protein